MTTRTFSAGHRLVSSCLLGILLAGCGGAAGSGPRGAYVPKHPENPMVFFEKFDFQSGDTVAVTAFGKTESGKYVVTEDGRVEITMPAGQMAHLKDAGDGCLTAVSDPGIAQEAAKDGVDLDEMGRYCRE